MFLKLTANIKPSRKKLEATMSFEKDERWIFTTSKPHGLKAGDVVLLKTENGEEKVKVLSEKLTDTTFKVDVAEMFELKIDGFFEGENNVLVSLREPLPFMIGDKEAIEKSFTVIKVWEESAKDEETGEITVTKQEQPLLCTMLNSKYGFEIIGTEEQYHARYYVYNDNYFNIVSGEILENIEVYLENSLKLSVPLINKNDEGLGDEDRVNYLFNEKKKSLIPEIVDYEKMIFSPCYEDGGRFYDVQSIKFNLFFRERTTKDDEGNTVLNKEWNTNDLLGWNQYYAENYDRRTGVVTFMTDGEIKEGDLLGHLGFTDEDVYYQKQRLTQSFLRLSFYNSPDPLNKMLLFYSTVYVDSADLYNKYVKNLNKKTEDTPLVFCEDVEADDRLSATFTLYDKYNRTKSSEGFYLYMFPDGVTEETERTVYMTIEFNHAGYGKTIPFMMPYKGTDICTFGSDFPTSFCTFDESTGIMVSKLEEYNNFQHIPVKLRYDGNGFKYYFPICDLKNGQVTINAYEPRINTTQI